MGARCASKGVGLWATTRSNSYSRAVSQRLLFGHGATACPLGATIRAFAVHFLSQLWYRHRSSVVRHDRAHPPRFTFIAALFHSSPVPSRSSFFLRSSTVSFDPVSFNLLADGRNADILSSRLMLEKTIASPRIKRVHDLSHMIPHISYSTRPPAAI